MLNINKYIENNNKILYIINTRIRIAQDLEYNFHWQK